MAIVSDTSTLDPNYTGDDDPNLARGERRAAIVSLVVGIALLAIKFAAYFFTGSSAIFSDALESIVNVIASGFALFAISYSHQPADRSHPYGHGKVEFFSAAIEGSMILLAAVVILARAVQDLWVGPQVEQLDIGIPLLAITMVANGIIGFSLIRRGKKNGSIALEADGHHLMSDVITSGVVLVALVAVRQTGIVAIDPICAIVMSFYIAWVGVRLVRRSAAGLMDEQDPEDDRKICELLDSHIGASAVEPRICSYHKLRHRHVGRYHWIDFHLVVPGTWDIALAHRAASEIEHEIEQMLGHADATAHVEPCISEACDRCPT
jgi:cation diffusion facilitator family transporter